MAKRKSTKEQTTIYINKLVDLTNSESVSMSPLSSFAYYQRGGVKALQRKCTYYFMIL